MSNRVQFRRYDTPPTTADRIRATSDDKELAKLLMKRAYVQNDLPGIVFHGFCYLAYFLTEIHNKTGDKED